MDKPISQPEANVPAAPRLRMNAGDWALLVTLSVLWGGSFFFSKVALGSLPPLTLALGRVALAAAALGIVLLAGRHGLPNGRVAIRALATMAILNNVVPFSLIFFGQTQIASALAAVLNATTPLFTVLVMQARGGAERLSAGKVGGVLLGLGGVAMMLLPRLSPVGADSAGAPLLGMAACLGAAFSYGLAARYGLRFARMGLKPMQIAFGQLFFASLWLLPLAAAVERFWLLPAPTPVAVAALAALAFASTALAYVLFFRLMARAGATNVSLVTLLVPVSAVLLGIGILGERLTGVEVAGIVLIALGLVSIDGRLQEWIRRR